MTLDYAKPAPPVPPSASYLRIALICGIVPATVGFLILLGYAVFRADFFQALGLVWLLAGAMIVLVGGVLLLTYFVRCLRSNQCTRRTTIKIVLVSLLLLSNFGAAWVCIVVGSSLSTRHFVSD